MKKINGAYSNIMTAREKHSNKRGRTNTNAEEEDIFNSWFRAPKKPKEPPAQRLHVDLTARYRGSVSNVRLPDGTVMDVHLPVPAVDGQCFTFLQQRFRTVFIPPGNTSFYSAYGHDLRCTFTTDIASFLLDQVISIPHILPEEPAILIDCRDDDLFSLEKAGKVLPLKGLPSGANGARGVLRVNIRLQKPIPPYSIAMKRILTSLKDQMEIERRL